MINLVNVAGEKRMPLVEELGIDLGTVNVLVYVRGRGIVLQEPSVVAQQIDNGEVVAVGEEARAMMGRAPETIQVRRPLRDGVIADYRITQKMLYYFVNRAIGKTIAQFDDIVARIERQDYQIAARPAKLCQSCDMRAYCDNKNWTFRKNDK